MSYICHIRLILCLLFQQTQPVVHKLLGARLYDSRSKRPKLKPTDRRPTVNVAAAADDGSGDSDCVKPPQTIDDMRRMRNRRLHTGQQVLNPYVSKRTAAIVEDDHGQRTSRNSEHCCISAEASTTTDCITSVSHSISTFSGHVLPVHSSKDSSNVAEQNCETNELVHSAGTSRLPKEKLMKYISAIG